jgi:hypothetical protein
MQRHAVLTLTGDQGVEFRLRRNVCNVLTVEVVNAREDTILGEIDASRKPHISTNNGKLVCISGNSKTLGRTMEYVQKQSYVSNTTTLNLDMEDTKSVRESDMIDAFSLLLINCPFSEITLFTTSAGLIHKLSSMIQLICSCIALTTNGGFICTRVRSSRIGVVASCLGLESIQEHSSMGTIVKVTSDSKERALQPFENILKDCFECYKPIQQRILTREIHTLMVQNEELNADFETFQRRISRKRSQTLSSSPSTHPIAHALSSFSLESEE